MTTEATAAASFTQTEEEIRRFWQRNDVPQAARAARRESKPFVIKQEPLSVLGPPWIDQIRLLSTTDLFTRYHSMRGKTVRCETGWACHGLELELAVERSLGPALADCDIAEFNAICRDTAVQGTRLGEGQAERLGVWFQSEHAFSSLTSESIGTVWRILNRLWDEGRLRSQQRVGAYCTRCATHLSAEEASQSSVGAEASPVWVRLPWDGKPDAYFLARASAPWMLMGMVALAAHPDANYLLVEAVEGPARQDLVATRLLVSEEAAARSLPNGFRTVQSLRGQELRDARFRPLFTFLPDAAATGRIILSRSVPLEEGTGLMPVTPAFEGLSLELAQAHSLPIPELLDEWGSLDEMVASWRGLSPLDAEPLLVDDLHARGLVVREATMKRPQAICPYCDTPLLQLARPVWLAGDGDSQWVVDRSRPWGTPFPIWVCSDCAEQLCVAGLDELGHLTGLELEEGDLHRPAIDRLTFACKSCDGLMRRVTPVVDTSFELAVLSAAAQAGPADLAIALDRGDRGWLQDTDQLGTILQQAVGDRPAIALPRKVVGRSWDHTRSSSGDALRWATYTDSAPHLAEAGFLRQVQHLVQDLLAEPVQRQNDRRLQLGTEEALLDHWILARLHETVSAVTEALDSSHASDAAGFLAELVDDISGWYAIYRPGCGQELCGTLGRLLAPFVPHLADLIHARVEGRTVSSVHLATWPTPDPAWQDSKLLAQMALVQQLAGQGVQARDQAGLDPGARLARALVATLSTEAAPAGELVLFEGLLVDALGVDRVEFSPDAELQVRWRLLPISDRLVSRSVPAAEIETTLAGLEPEVAAELAAPLRKGYSVSLQVCDQTITLLPDEVEIRADARPGWAAAVEGPYLVVLTMD